VARRMLAIARVLEGCSRTEAAETCAMERQTLRDWVHRFNASGLDGLLDQPRRNGPLHACRPSSRPRSRPGWTRVLI
jgi:transposase